MADMSTRGGARGRRSLLWLSIATLAALATLVGLGTWQLERKAWKEALIGQIRVRSQAEPIVLDAATLLHAAGEDIEYTPVRARGRLQHAASRLYYAPEASGPGYHVYTPLVTPSGQILMVNRGFIPEAQKAKVLAPPQVDPEQIAGAPQRATADLVEIVGLARKPASRGWFTPDNDPARNLWYWRDLKGMVASLPDATGGARYIPFFIEAVAQSDGRDVGLARPRDGEPRPGVTRMELPNRHLEYALTWYGLAGALIIVYLAFTRGRMRGGERRVLGDRWLRIGRDVKGSSRRGSWGKS